MMTRVSTNRSSLARVEAEADRLGLSITVQQMSQSTRTAADAAEACGASVGQIVKSLVFENAENGRLILLLVSGAHDADLTHLAAKHALKLVRCDARRVRTETGFAIGGVAPIGAVERLEVFMDESLLDHDIVWCAAGRHDAVFSVDPGTLARVTDARMVSVRG